MHLYLHDDMNGGSGKEHAHEHTHFHAHEHTHADGTTHTHDHEHVHTHEHTHPHSHTGEHGAHDHHHHGEGSVSAQTIALLSYMLGHNRDHADEIHEMAHKLEAEGHTEEASLIHAGVASLNEGNDRLAEALAMLKGEK